MTVVDVDGTEEHQVNGNVEVMMPLHQTHPSDVIIAGVFAFDDDELEALQAFEKVKRSTGPTANAVASSEAGAGRQRAGTARNDVENNTKPKEQND